MAFSNNGRQKQWKFIKIIIDAHTHAFIILKGVMERGRAKCGGVEMESK
jgi:hypothetical protein